MAEEVKEELDEYAGGTIIENRCPECGRFVKKPEYYQPCFEEMMFVGSYADAYCEGCEKIVKLAVEYI